MLECFKITTHTLFETMKAITKNIKQTVKYDAIISKADKGNTVTIFYKSEYTQQIEDRTIYINH